MVLWALSVTFSTSGNFLFNYFFLNMRIQSAESVVCFSRMKMCRDLDSTPLAGARLKRILKNFSLRVWWLFKVRSSNCHALWLSVVFHSEQTRSLLLWVQLKTNYFRTLKGQNASPFPHPLHFLKPMLMVNIDLYFWSI